MDSSKQEYLDPIAQQVLEAGFECWLRECPAGQRMVDIFGFGAAHQHLLNLSDQGFVKIVMDEAEDFFTVEVVDPPEPPLARRRPA